MTLALYGKSRKRQGGLIFSAFMAIMVAAIGGVAMIGTALAHHATITGTVTCQANGSYTVNWKVENSQSDKVMWVATQTNPAVGATAAISPSPITKNTDGGGPLGNGTTSTTGIPAGTSSVTLGVAVYWTTNADGTGTRVPSGSGTQSYSETINPSAVCDGKIIIKKYVPDGDNTTTVFSADVQNTTTNTQVANDTTFSEAGAPGDREIVIAGANNTNLTVTENALSGYQLTGVAVMNGDVDCNGYVSFGAAGAASVSDLDAGETKTVCFKNEPRARIIIKKVVSGPGSSAADNFTAAVDNNEDSSGEASGLNFSQNTPYIHQWNEDDNDNDFDVTETNANTNGYEVVGTYVGTGDVTCPAVPASGTTGWDTTTPNNAESGLGDIDNGETRTVCFWNRKLVQPSVSVTKDAPLGVYNLGQSFAWTITATVTNGPTTANYDIFDQVPSQFQINSVAINDPHNNPDKLTCITTDPVSCTLASGAATGSNYTITVNVTVKNGATCGPVTNSVRNSNNPYTGTVVATDIIDVEGCGNINWNKANGVLDMANNEIDWTITIQNTSVVAGSITIYDAGTSLDSETCSNAVSESPADTYTCNVPGSTTVSLVLSTPLPGGYDPVCDNIDVNNTASVVGGASDTAEYSDTAEGPLKNCIKVAKDKSDTSEPPTWNIGIQNTADVAMNVWVVDSGATYQGATGGTCTATAGVTSMSSGIACSVNANGTLIISVTKGTPTATCEGTDVNNSVSVWVGRYEATPTTAPDYTDTTGNQFENLNADPALCNNIIRLCKVWAFDTLNEISDGTANFTFSVNGTFVNINNVTEGNLTPACILLEVANGVVNISEQLTAGFTAEGWTINNPASSGSGGTVEFELSSDGCYELEEESLVGTLVGLVRQAISVVTVVTEGDPVCTVTFRNHDDQNNEPTGAIRVEKYLDINGDGDANDTGEGLIPGWDVTIAGPVVNGTFDLADGTYSWLGLETGDVYMLTEATVAGYTVTNATVNGVTIGASTFAGAAVPNGGFTIVRFYNKPQGSIIVHKVAVTRQGFGPETDAPNDDDGWTITVSSAQCGINISKQTDANGNAVFAGLPLCTDYVVSENPVNASSPGFNPVSPVSVSGQTPNGQTITFKNRKDAEDPRCTVNCGPSTATPTTPTTPPTTVVPPTTTPIPPVIPPVTQVAGEKTPGASATPIAPSTGGGIIGGATGGTNLVLIIAGILALTSGLSFVALGRKSRR